MARSRGAVDHLDDEDDDTPPWLAPAEEEEVRRPRSRSGAGARGRAPVRAADDEPTVVPRRRVWFWAALLALLFVVVVALLYASIAKPEDEGALIVAVDGEAPLIRAPDTPYKERPADAGGTVEGEGLTAYEAAGGVDPGGELALDALPEEPLPRPTVAANDAPAAAPAEPAPAPVATLEQPKPAGPASPQPAKVAAAPAKQPAAPAPEKPAAPPKPAADRLAALDKELAAAKPAPAAPKGDAGSFALQLGAFSTNAKANEVWKGFSGRYGYLKDLSKSIVAIERDGKTLYRLRAAGLTSRSQAENLCARLRVAGESCTVAE